MLVAYRLSNKLYIVFLRDGFAQTVVRVATSR